VREEGASNYYKSKIVLKARGREHSKQKPAGGPDCLLARSWQQAKRPRHIPWISFAGKYRDTPIGEHRLKLGIGSSKPNLIHCNAGFRDAVNVQYHFSYRSLFYTVGYCWGILAPGVCSSNQSTFHKYFHSLSCIHSEYVGKHSDICVYPHFSSGFYFWKKLGAILRRASATEKLLPCISITLLAVGEMVRWRLMAFPFWREERTSLVLLDKSEVAKYNSK